MSFENTELLVTLNVGEIGYILCNLEKEYGQLLDGEIPEEGSPADMFRLHAPDYLNIKELT